MGFSVFIWGSGGCYGIMKFGCMDLICNIVLYGGMMCGCWKNSLIEVC